MKSIKPASGELGAARLVPALGQGPGGKRLSAALPLPCRASRPASRSPAPLPGGDPAPCEDIPVRIPAPAGLLRGEAFLSRFVLLPKACMSLVRHCQQERLGEGLGLRALSRLHQAPSTLSTSLHAPTAWKPSCVSLAVHVGIHLKQPPNSFWASWGMCSPLPSGLALTRCKHFHPKSFHFCNPDSAICAWDYLSRYSLVVCMTSAFSWQCQLIPGQQSMQGLPLRKKK